MGVSSLAAEGHGATVDLSDKGLHKLEADVPCGADTHTLILDRNHIIKLEHLEKSCELQQLSVAGNRLVRMMGVSQLTKLRVLNLPNNSIGHIEGLRDLAHLEWLNLGGNNIKAMDQLGGCVALQHLDLSDNNISHVGDLSALPALKTLLLHGNIITTLRSVPAHLPPSLAILSLAENEIRDLNEVSFLAYLPSLEQLSIMSNPCVMATPALPGFDCRPYVVSWCLNLKVLDGYVVSQKEGLKAEWLYSQGKGRLFRPGQHVQLVQYLAAVCPLTSASSLQSAEDAKLEKILNKQRLHQKQLLQQRQSASPSPPRPTRLDVEEQLVPSPALLEAPALPDQREPVVQLNTWLVGEHSYSAAAPPPSTSHRGDPLFLEDVQTDEDKLSFNLLLSSESNFLYQCDQSVAPPCPPARSHSDDEPDEPDSLIPDSPVGEGLEAELRCPYAQVDGEVVLGTCIDCTAVRSEVQAKRQAGPTQADEAAVKIQAWWRGIWTRQCHPLAREVRAEIRLRRMQEHIVFLSAELRGVQEQLEEERLQRLVQEEAVKYLWKQLQSVMESQRSLEDRLSAVPQSSPQPPQPALRRPLAPCTGSAVPASSQLSFPDSGFQSSSEPLGVTESSTGGSVEMVRELRGGPSEYEDQDCGLLQQYLCSVQQREEEEEQEEEEEEEEEGASDRVESLPPLLCPSPAPTHLDPPPDDEATGHQEAPWAGGPSSSP